jgi:hypothetical protein
LQAGANLLEWELAPEQPVYLRAMWALVADPAGFRRPEWMAPQDAPAQDSLVRFTGSFDISFVPEEGTLHTATAFGCRVLVNGVEVGRQGGFDPYGFQMRTYRHATAAFRQGHNTVTLEVDDPGRLVEASVDVRVRGRHGESATFSSGAHWQVARGSGPADPVALRRFQNMSWNQGAVGVTVDPPAADLWRRPHPLPGAHWLEDAPADGTVVAVAPDAFGGRSRVEWLRWTLPPGAQAVHLPIQGIARLWVDGTELPITAGTATLPPSDALQRKALLRVEPQGGHSEGGLLAGPVTYTSAAGPIGLGPWPDYGLAAYSGGLRYAATISLDSQQLAAVSPGVTAAGNNSAARVILDLGAVRGTAEVWVNDQPIGTRIWSPYHFDVTAALQEGPNRVEVLVLNTLGPYLRATSPTNYVFGPQELSGLLGPVRLLRV